MFPFLLFICFFIFGAFGSPQLLPAGRLPGPKPPTGPLAPPSAGNDGSALNKVTGIVTAIAGAISAVSHPFADSLDLTPSSLDLPHSPPALPSPPSPPSPPEPPSHSDPDSDPDSTTTSSLTTSSTSSTRSVSPSSSTATSTGKVKSSESSTSSLTSVTTSSSNSPKTEYSTISFPTVTGTSSDDTSATLSADPGSSTYLSTATGDATAPTSMAAASSEEKSGPNIPAIVGGSLAVLVVILLAILILHRCRRARRNETEFFRDLMVRRRSQGPTQFTPVTIPSMERSLYPTDPEKFSELSDDPIVWVQQRHLSLTSDSTFNDKGTSLESARISPVVFSKPPTTGGRASLDIRNALWTDRQVGIHNNIVNLQAKLIGSQLWSSSLDQYQEDPRVLKERLAKLERLMQTSWALGFTDELPTEYEDVF